MKCAVEQFALGGGNLKITVDGPVFQRIGIFTHHAFARAGSVQQNGIEHFWHCRTKHAAIKMCERNITDATAADIGM